MTLGTIWIVAEDDGGVPSSLSLEMATAARGLADTVEAFVAGAGEPLAEELGAHGVTKVYATGDLGDRLLGVPGAAALARLIEAGGAPDAVFFGQTYDGRDIAGRLSVALDAPVLTNNVGVAVDDGALVVETPIFGGTQDVRTAFRGGPPMLSLFRPKSFTAEPSGAGPAIRDNPSRPSRGACVALLPSQSGPAHRWQNGSGRPCVA